MTTSSVDALLDVLRQCRLIDPSQLKELIQDAHGHSLEPRALARKLIERGWLTPYQVNLVLQGRGAELVLGSYVLLERLGEGGMGQVFKARHQVMNRVVALKVIRKDRLASGEALQRFRREVEASAQLAHPNIVIAHDAAQFGDRLVLVMEYVEGTDLAKRIKQSGPLPVAEACDYTRQAALGLQHAFEKGMVHRDIKPANLLLANDGSVKILDMGLARLNQAKDDDTASLTQEGAVVGTVDYLAPEQAVNSRNVDIRADLYSLGCTFYYLLTGQAPFPGGTAAEKLLRHNMDEPVPVEKLRRDVPSGVVAVLRKLMAKRPEQRYQTPAEVVAALAAPPAAIQAQPAAPVPAGRLTAPVASTPSAANGAPATPVRAAVATPPGQRTALSLGRWVWLTVAGGALTLVLLVVVMVVLLRPGRNRPSPEPTLPPLDRLSKEAMPASKRLAWHPKELVAVLGDESWRHWGPVTGVSISPDGKWVASSGGDGVIRLWEVSTGRLHASLDHAGAVSVAFAPDGQTLLSRSNDQLKLWDAASGMERPAPSKALAAPVLAAAWAPDGKLLAVAGTEKDSPKANPVPVLRVWDVASGEARAVLRGHAGAISAVAFARNGQLASGSDDHTVRLWDLAAGKERLVLASRGSGNITSVAFSPDGQIVAAGTVNQTARLWDVTSGKERGALTGHTATVTCVAFLADGRTVATGSSDHTMRLWDVTTLREKSSFRDYRAAVTSLAMATDGQTLISGGGDGRVRLWDPASGKERSSSPWYRLGAFSPDSKTLALIDGPTVELWDAATSKLRPLRGHEELVQRLAITADGQTLVSSSSDQTVKIWDMVAGRERASVHGGPNLILAADGSSLATWAGNPEVRLWEVTSAKQSAFFNESFAVESVAFAPDGKTLVLAGSRSSVIRLWDVARVKDPTSFDTRHGGVTGLALSPDGKTLATGHERQDMRLWDWGARKERLSLQGTSSVSARAFSLDSRLLATAGVDRWVVVWDVSKGSKVREWRFPGPVSQVAFAADGRHLATSNSNGTVYILRVVEASAGTR
jgi:WD40 repeat protein/tRNA A-37 threonylcarbamoyl transferase component Bud32